jgi:hypothetical protein
MTYRVRYQYGEFSGHITVEADTTQEATEKAKGFIGSEAGVELCPSFFKVVSAEQQ